LYPGRAHGALYFWVLFVPAVLAGKDKAAIHGRKIDELPAIQAGKAKPAIHGRTLN
jgi:hypothetical protein